MSIRKWLATALVFAACRPVEPVRIGIVLSSDGVAGAELAVAEINESGGIRGRPLALRVIAAAGSTTMARPAIVAAESLSLDPNVMAVVGHSNSSASLAASQIYNAHGVVQIAPTSSAPMMSRTGRYTFRLVASDNHQARFLADAITTDGARPRTAVFFVNDDYGHGLKRELLARLADRQVPVVFEAPYSQERPIADVPGTARAITRARPEVFVWLGRAAQLRQLLPDLRRSMPSLRVLASDGVDDANMGGETDSTLFGIEYVSFLAPDAVNRPLDELRARFQAKMGMRPSAQAALVYDAVKLLAAAARDVRPERLAIHDYLTSLGGRRPAYAGVTGPIVFNSSGGPPPSYFLHRVAPRPTSLPAAKAWPR